MNAREHAELAELLADHESPCLSLYQPTHRRHPENQQDPIRYKNLVKSLEESLRKRYSTHDVRALLGVLQGDKASKGFLTTTSDFAPKLRDDILLKPFMPAQLELINGKMLLAQLEELAKKKA